MGGGREGRGKKEKEDDKERGEGGRGEEEKGEEGGHTPQLPEGMPLRRSRKAVEGWMGKPKVSFRPRMATMYLHKHRHRYRTHTHTKRKKRDTCDCSPGDAQARS